MTSGIKKIPLSQNPIFVVGYPRSGTTLLQALLATQGDLATFPETHFFSTIFEGQAEFTETIDLTSAEKALDKIVEKFEASLADCLIKELQAMPNPSKIYIKDFFEIFVSKILPGGESRSRRWLEKTPNHGLYLEHIRGFYPEAKFIGIIRNPFNAINSWLKYFPPRINNRLVWLSNHWVKHVTAFEYFKTKYPENAQLIKYEELTENPERSISSICDFINIVFEPQKLENYQKEAKNIIQPFEYWKGDVIKTVILTSNEDPKKFFSIREILEIQSIVLEKMKKYGYKTKYPLLQQVYDFSK